MTNEILPSNPPEGPNLGRFAWPVCSLLVLAGLFFVHRQNDLFRDQQVKTLIIACIGIVALIGAFHAILGKTQRIDVKYIIAFDVVTFVVLGLIAVISTTLYWQTASLCAGACLLGGGIIGLLFGLPLGSDNLKNQADQAQAVASKKVDTASSAVIAKPEPDTEALQTLQDAKTAKTNADLQAVSSNRHNLLSETASSLSKILAGASLAKFQSLLNLFKSTAIAITACVTASPSVDTKGVLGGAIILYFGLVGFIAGLVLPAYFMSNWQQGGTHDPNA